MAAPMTDPDDLDVLLEQVGGAQVVMLGEASHGTHDFYRWRELITRRLIAEHGFSFVAVEGDWPDCDRVDRNVRGSPDPATSDTGPVEGGPDYPGRHDPQDVLATFARWPTWMWANQEVGEFTRWLRRHNATVEPEQRVGFHGLDLYSLWESLHEILNFLHEHEPEQVPAALTAYRCFEPYRDDPQQYARAVRLVPRSCEDEVVDLLVERREQAVAGGADRFGAWQNAEVVAGAEDFYRSMLRGGHESWNVRDRHMDRTLDRLLGHYGPGAKAVVWAHNTHVGDARATDMARAGEVNLGQLARERFGDRQVALVGFGSYTGTVVAGAAWGAPAQLMAVPPARTGSLEDELHDAAPPQALLTFSDSDRPGLLTEPLDHRAIGVVYQPGRERWGNYVPTVVGDRYDAFVWCDRTRGLRPLHGRPIGVEELETYPSGV